MSDDLQNIPAAERARLIRIGRTLSSPDVLAQGNAVLEALDAYGDLLQPYGYGAGDRTELAELRDLGLGLSVDRQAARGESREAAHARAEGMQQGKRVRRQARVVLAATEAQLRRDGREAALAAATRLALGLDATARSGADPVALLTQLERLAALFAEAEVAQAAAERGGAALAESLPAAVAALRELAASAQPPRGTPEATERLDLIDGLIVENVRAARRAARAAADDLGRPALAKAFELSLIAGRPRHPAAPPASAAPAV